MCRAGKIPQNNRYAILNDIRYLEVVRYRYQTIFDIYTQGDTAAKRYTISSISARFQ